MFADNDSDFQSGLTEQEGVGASPNLFNDLLSESNRQQQAEKYDTWEEPTPVTHFSYDREKDLYVLKSKGITVEIPRISSDEKKRALFDELTPEMQDKFLSRRLFVLSYTLKFFSNIQYTSGIGALFKERLFYVFHRNKNKLSNAKTVIERSERITKSIVLGLDNVILDSPRIFIDSNEFSVFIAGNIQSLTGVKDKGHGASVDLGISLGFDIKNKAVVGQIFRVIDTYKNTDLPAITSIGVGPRAGFLFRSVNNDEHMTAFHGEGYIPPAVPVYKQKGSKHAIMGGTITVVGFPPPPTDLALTYSTHHNFKSWLYVAFSPMMKGFFRIKLGINKQSFIYTRDTVINLVHRLIEFGKKDIREISLPKFSLPKALPVVCEKIY